MKPTPVIPAGIAIVAVTYGLARYAYGLFLPTLQAAFRFDAAFAGVLAGGASVAYLLATIMASVLTARVGPRLPVLVGGLSAAVGMLLIAEARALWMLATGVVLAGASAGWAWPPMPDAVARLIHPDRQNSVLAAINSGTSYGVIMAAPIAFVAGSAWRLAWLVFAVLAVAATLWNVWLLPTGPDDRSAVSVPRLRWGWFVCPLSGPLLLSAFVFGLAGSVYWTFAVILIATTGAFAALSGRIFFALVGAAGLVGPLAGSLVARLGLQHALRWSIVGLAAAIGLLPLALASGAAVLGSAILFGGFFIIVSGLLAVWNMTVFYARPSAGLGAIVSLIAIGQLVGPALTGLLAGRVGLAPTFYGAGVLMVTLVFVVPRMDRRARPPHKEKGHSSWPPSTC
jgi:predicted MFS family arabinose efflux permease